MSTLGITEDPAPEHNAVPQRPKMVSQPSQAFLAIKAEAEKKQQTQKRKPYFGLTGKWLAFWVNLACNTAMTLFGYDQGVFGGIIVTDSFLDTLGIADNTNMQSTITSLYDVGCFFGAISAFIIGGYLGRRRTIILGTTIMMIGAILQISCYGVPQMIVGRLVAGYGNGLNTASAPVWQSETNTPERRGPAIITAMILNIAGYSLSNWLTYGFSFLDGPVAWRFPLAFQLVFGIILLTTVPWLPESPRWLLTKGRDAEAIQILADLEGRDCPIDDPKILAERNEIIYAIELERQAGVTWGQLLRGKGGTGTLRRLLLGAGTQAMQQFSGINVTSYYLPTVLETSVGLSNDLARLLAACNSVSYLLFSFISIPKIEGWGRRRTLMGAAGGQGFSYLMITILLGLSYTASQAGNDEKSSKLATAAVAFFFLYYVFFGVGFQGIPWLYPTEINSLQMRTKGAALGTATNWAVNYMVVQVTPIGINSIHWKFYIIWTIFNFSFIPITYFFYPETSGRRLEDIDALFRENHSIWIYKDKDAISTQRPQKYRDVEEGEIKNAGRVEKDASASGGMFEQRENVADHPSDTDSFSHEKSKFDAPEKKKRFGLF